MAGHFKLALGQSPADLSGTNARLHWLSNILPELQEGAVDLLLLPELFATGYNIPDLRARAETADGQIAQAIARLAKGHDVAIHYGYPEKDGTQIFNATQCIGPDGSVIGQHRKLIIPPGFETEVFSPGKGCRLFSYRGLNIATLICYDAEFAETVRHVATLGAMLVLVPTALGDQWGWVAETMMPTRAYENGVFLGYANSAGLEHGMGFLGQSFIAAPDGEILAKAGLAPEILYAELDINRLTAAQARLPYLSDRTRIKLE